MVLTALVRFPMTCSPAVRLLSVRLFAALSVRVCGDGALHAKVVHHALRCAPALLEHPERDDGQRHAEGLDQQATWSGLAMTSVPTSAGVPVPPYRSLIAPGDPIGCSNTQRPGYSSVRLHCRLATGGVVHVAVGRSQM